MDAVTQVVVWLNAAADAVGCRLLAPIAWTPAWLSTTVVGAVTGVVMLVIFKYTSNQRAIKRVRDGISADLLAVKLFKDSPAVALGAQGRLLLGAGRLLLLALIPMAVMIVPVTLLLGQLSLWYEKRPLAVGAEAVVTVRLGGPADAPYPKVSLQAPDGVEDLAGPIRVRTDAGRELWWNVQAKAPGYHRLTFLVDGQPVEKELAAGDGFMRVSPTRPGWSWFDALLHPSEQPFGRNSAVQGIEIDYAGRDSLPGADESWPTCLYSWPMRGAGWLRDRIGVPGWMIYWFAVSLVVGLCFSRVLKVNI